MAVRMLKKLALLLPPVQRRYEFLRRLGAEHEAMAIRLAEAHAHIEHLNRALGDSLTETGALQAPRDLAIQPQGLETRIYVLTSDLQRSIERNDRLHHQIHTTADLLRDLRNEVGDLRREQADLIAERDAHAATNRDLQAECADLRLDMGRLEIAAATALALRERAAELEIRLVEADRRLDDEKGKTAFRDTADLEEIETLRLRAYVLKSDLERAIERNSLLSQNLQTVNQALEASIGKVEAAESRRTEVENALQSAQANLLEALQRSTELEYSRHNVDAALSSAESERRAVEARLQLLSQHLIDANADLAATRSALSSSEAKLDVLAPEMADLRQNVVDLEAALTASQAELEKRGAQ